MPGDDTNAAVERLQAELRELQERYAASQAALADRDRALAEAYEQQTATGEILRVIASSPSDRARVRDAVVASARRL